MATGNATKTKTAEKPLDLDQQVTVRSIAGWQVGFARITGLGDVTIPKRGTIRLSRNEIISQVQIGNKLFTGIDGVGSHATLLIEDEATKKEIGYANSSTFNDDLVNKLFDIKDQQVFEEELKNTIRTRAEKYALMLSIMKLNKNDFSKIRYIEKYTGYKMDKIEQDEKNIR